MPVATKQMSISSYFITKSLIEHLETYLKNEVPEVLNFESDTNTSGATKLYTVTLYDSQGNESYTSITDYKFAAFRNDIKSISLDFNYTVKKKTFSLALRFGDDSKNTDIALTIADDNPQEKIAAISNGITTILNQNKTINRLFYIPEFISSLLSIACLLCGVIALSGDYSRKTNFLLGLIFYIGVFYFVTVQIFKPYSSFDSTRQKQLDTWYNWLVTGLLGFLLFSTLLTTVRKTIFSF